MKFGVHSALWLRSWQDDLMPYLEKSAALGFDGIEISLLSDISARRLRHVAERLRLEITCTFGLKHDIGSGDATVRRAGQQELQRAIDQAAAVGSTLLCGVLYGTWGRCDGIDLDERRARAIEILATGADYAQRAGIELAIEPLNRYETDLLNSAAQANEMASRIGAPNLGILLDTYHMNIEEKDTRAAIEQSGGRLLHLHCVANDRGVPGSGSIDWNGVAAGLRAIGYDRWLTLEMFVRPGLAVSPDLSIWRSIEDDPDRAAADGLRFLKERFGDQGDNDNG